MGARNDKDAISRQIEDMIGVQNVEEIAQIDGVRRIYQYEPYRVDLCAACISSNFKASTHMQELTKNNSAWIHDCRVRPSGLP